MDERRRQEYYSDAIKVLLLPTATEQHDGDVAMAAEPSDGAEGVRAACSAYLRTEREQMEQRIRDFVRSQHDQFERLLARTTSERDHILRLVNKKSEKATAKEQTTTNSSGIGAALEQRQQWATGGADSAVHLSPASVGSGLRPADMSAQPNSRNRTLISERETADDALFPLDEDQPPTVTTFLPIDDDTDEKAIDTDDSGNGDEFYSTGNERQGTTKAEPKRPAIPGAGMLASKFGTSLPVTIPGRFWPPKDAKDSIPDGARLSSDDENDDDDDDSRRVHQRTVLPTTHHKDLYRGMRAQARSIQAADDPERLFGERPQRRRYRTGEARMRTAATARVETVVIPTGASEQRC